MCARVAMYKSASPRGGAESTIVSSAIEIRLPGAMRFSLRALLIACTISITRSISVSAAASIFSSCNSGYGCVMMVAPLLFAAGASAC
ncbi:MAG: hypothetical protein MPL62_16935, partial [Alphaproteobacteria bacterium]|nr:hypothetical protein [Alphaproteobacteria bacterium]